MTTKKTYRRIAYISTALLIIILLMQCGCSAERQIAVSSTGISALAHSSKERFGTINEQASAPRPDLIVIREQAVLGGGEQEKIIDNVAAIVAALPGVQDTTPWWAVLATWSLVAVSSVAITITLWQSGILSVCMSGVRRALTSMAGWVAKNG